MFRGTPVGRFVERRTAASLSRNPAGPVFWDPSGVRRQWVHLGVIVAVLALVLGGLAVVRPTLVRDVGGAAPPGGAVTTFDVAATPPVLGDGPLVRVVEIEPPGPTTRAIRGSTW